MKTQILTLLTTALLGFGLSACSSPAASAGVKPYPLDTCLVTGNELGSMGTPITQVHGNREIKFCCQPCVKKFAANPAKYLARLPQ